MVADPGTLRACWFFAGGRETRISSLELAKFYSSRAQSISGDRWILGGHFDLGKDMDAAGVIAMLGGFQATWGDG